MTESPMTLYFLLVFRAQISPTVFLTLILGSIQKRKKLRLESHHSWAMFITTLTQTLHCVEEIFSGNDLFSLAWDRWSISNCKKDTFFSRGPGIKKPRLRAVGKVQNSCGGGACTHCKTELLKLGLDRGIWDLPKPQRVKTGFLAGRNTIRLIIQGHHCESYSHVFMVSKKSHFYVIKIIISLRIKTNYLF